MAGAQVAISALPTSTTVVTGDVLGLVIGGATKRITAGNLRSQLFAYAATDPLNCGILTAVGNSTITGTLSGITTLTAGSIVGNLTGAVTGNLTGTVLTAAQANITSLGTLTGLAIAGNITATIHVSNTTQLSDQTLRTTNALDLLFGTASVTRWYIAGAGVNPGAFYAGADNSYDIGATATNRPRNVYIAGLGILGGALTIGGSVTMSTAVSVLIPGATSFSHRNNANTADNVLITDAGAVTIRAGLTITAGGMTVTAGGTTLSGGLIVTGGITMNTAVSQLVPGATSLSFRNNANAADNLLISDAGVVTVRSNLKLATAVSKIIPGATSLSFRDTADANDNLIITDVGAVTIRSTAIVPGGSASNAGFIITPRIGDPSSPNDGEMWVTTAGVFKLKMNGVVKTVTVT